MRKMNFFSLWQILFSVSVYGVHVSEIISRGFIGWNRYRSSAWESELHIRLRGNPDRPGFRVNSDFNQPAAAAITAGDFSKAYQSVTPVTIPIALAWRIISQEILDPPRIRSLFPFRSIYPPPFLTLSAACASKANF